MKLNTRLLALALLPIVLFCAYVLYSRVDDALNIYPTPETQSAFLKSYTPEHVAARFRCNRYSSHSTGGESAELGRKFATTEKRFDQYFVIQTRDWMPIMTALGQDVSSKLLSQGAQILDQTGDSHDGFKFQYKSGKTLGIVSVEPLNIVDPEAAIGHLTSGRPNTICPGEMAVELRVSVQERYFKKDRGLITAKF